MANVFDQFDAPPPAAGAAAPVPSADDLISRAKSQGSYVPSADEAKQMSQDLSDIAAKKDAAAKQPNPFDQFDQPPGRERPASLGSVASNVGAGANDAIAGTLGAPVDIANAGIKWLQNQPRIGEQRSPIPSPEQFLGYVARLVPPASDAPFGGSESVKKGLGAIGANPDDVQANNALERIARGTGAGVAGMVLPYGGARAAMEAGASGPLVDTLGAGSLKSNAAIGAVSGATGEGAAEAVPEPYQGPARILGNIAGGGLAAVGAAGTRALSDAAVSVGRQAAAPFTESGREMLAGQRIARGASDPGALPGKLDVENPDLVPGSSPTTFQLSGDQGIGQMERAARSRTPEPFLERAATQNAARVGALDALSPSGAQPGAVGEFFTRHLADIDAYNAATIQYTQNRAATALNSIGGNLDRDQYGSALRSILSDANTAAKARESSLWQAIDPDGKLALDASPVSQGAARIAGEMAQSAKPMEGEEAAIFRTAQQLPQVAPFSELTALRSRIQAAIRQERFQGGGETPALRRLSMLQGEIDGAIADGVDGHAAQEAEAVKAGTLAPRDTFAARLLESQQQWYADKDAQSTALSGGSSAGPGARSVGNAGIRPNAIPGASGAEGQARGRSAQSPGVSGVPEEPLTPNFDKAAADRYADARTATRERKQTFKTGPVGQTLAPGQAGTQYRLADSQVAGKFFNSGPKAAEDVQSFVNAAGSRSYAVSLLHDYAASDLRRFAEMPDGTINPKRLETWLGKHDDALRAFPDLRARFESVGAAQQAVIDTAAANKLARDAYESSAARFFLKADPDVAVRRALSSENPGQTFADLVSMTKGDAAASGGLRRAVADFIKNRLIGNNEGADTGVNFIKSDQFQTFAKRNQKALSQIFTPDQLRSIEAVAEDLQRSNRSVAGSKIPGQSNTTQDAAQIAKHTGNGSILSKLIVGGVGAAIGHQIGAGTEGALLGYIGTNALNAMREAGISRVDDLVTEAMLNPQLARTLLTKVRGAPEPYLADRLAKQLRALTLVSGTRQESDQGK